MRYYRGVQGRPWECTYSGVESSSCCGLEKFSLAFVGLADVQHGERDEIKRHFTRSNADRRTDTKKEHEVEWLALEESIFI
jgi:hypothetical protein